MRMQSTATDSTANLSPRQPKNFIEIRKRILKALLSEVSPLGNGGKWGSADVRLTVAAPDGFQVPMEVHREVFVRRSRFFAEKLRRSGSQVLTLEILESDDVEVYVEVLLLMYAEDLKRKLLGQKVFKVLRLLKACACLSFDDGVTACLEYLGEIPWSEEEEKKVVSHLTKLHLCNFQPIVLERVLSEPSTSSKVDDIFLKMSTAFLKAKNDRSRETMQATISGLLRKESSENRIAVSKETLYRVCRRYLSNLLLSLPDTICMDGNRENIGHLMSEIARKADNLEWILDILIERRIGEEFVQLWADRKEFSLTYSKTSTLFKPQLSRITAQLCAGIGEGRILVPEETRSSLLSTWFEAVCDDFSSMTFRSIQKKKVEEGLGNMILTLP